MLALGRTAATVVSSPSLLLERYSGLSRLAVVGEVRFGVVRSSLGSLWRNRALFSRILGVSGNDDLFDRQEIVRFLRLFTREDDMEYTGLR